MDRKFALGICIVGRNCQRLFYLRLAAALHDSIYRWNHHDRRFMPAFVAAHVFGLHRRYLWRVVVYSAGLLIRLFSIQELPKTAPAKMISPAANKAIPKQKLPGR